MKRLVPLLVIVVLGAAAWWLFDGGRAGDGAAPEALTRAGDATPAAPSTPQPAARDAVDVAVPVAPLTSESVAPAVAEVAEVAPWPEGMEHMSARGRVLDAAGAPVAGALVMLIVDVRTASRFPNHDDYRPFGMDPDVLPSAVTADDGSFLLRGPWFPDGGKHEEFTSLVVHTPEYAPHSFLLRGYAGGDFDAGDLVLSVPGAELRARLVDSSGAPQAGVGVAFGMPGWSDLPADAEHARRWDNHATHLRTLSDADGELRLTGLWPLTAPLYFVSDEHSFRHGQIDLRSGFLDLGTVLFDPHAGPSITGRVLGADGEPLADATVAVKGFERWNRPPPAPPGADEAGARMRGVSRRGVRTDANGRYVLRELDPDWVEHLIVVVAPGHEPALLRDVPFDSEAPELTLLPEATLDIDVRAADDGRALPEAAVSALRVTGTWETWNQELRALDVELEVDGTRVHQVGPFGTRLYVSAPGFAARVVEVEGRAPGSSRTLVVELEPAATLRVRAVDDTGAPVEGAEVRLRPPAEYGEHFAYMDLGEQHRGRTDADGLSVHSGLAVGAWRLDVSSPVHFGGRDVPCPVGSDDVEVEVELVRIASLRGTLLDADGAPLVGQVVLVGHPQRGAAAFEPWETAEVHTDVEGRFAYLPLRAGGVAVLAPRTEYQQFEIAAGEERELLLRQLAPFRLEGRVTSGGEPLAGAQVGYSGPLAQQRGVNWNNVATTDALGAYAFDVDVYGKLSVTAEVDGGGGEGAVVTSVPGGHAVQDLELGSASLGGVVLFPEGEHDLKWASLSLQPVAGGSSPRVSLAADGRFRFAPLAAGRYHLHVMVSGMRLAEELPTIELAEGEQRDDLELRLEFVGGVRGSIVWGSGEPFTGMLKLQRAGSQGYSAASVDGGRFDHDHLGPGTYELSATPGDFMEALATPPEQWIPTVPQLVTLTDGEERELDLVVPGSPPE